MGLMRVMVVMGVKSSITYSSFCFFLFGDFEYIMYEIMW